MNRPVDVELVPLGERLRTAQLCRYVIGTLMVVLWYAVPQYRGTSLGALVVATAAYLAVTAPSGHVSRLPRRTVLTIFNATLVVDGIYLAFASYATAGFVSRR
ncbi:MAG: hypothetical protein IRZ02_06820 [Acidothermus sp.]|nr:hypothetical protein [Acidothermus sp.]MCL6537199.1 hypothetical protein [Acidothermus sp.]